MPILLNDLTQNTNTTTYSAKFFDNKLTGSGKKIGILSEQRNPAYIPLTQKTTDEHIHCRRKKYTNGNTETTHIPLNIIPADAWGSNIKTVEIPDMLDLSEIAKMTKAKNNPQTLGTTLYVQMEPHSMILEETAPKYKGGAISRKLTTCYRIMLWFVNPNANDTTAQIINSINGYSIPVTHDNNAVIIDFTTNPRKWLMNTMGDAATYGFDVNDDAYVDFVDTYDLYSGVIKMAEKWQTTIDKTLDNMFKQTAANGFISSEMNCVALTLRAIENYNVPLNLYRDIYKSISKHFKANDATIMCKQNLNLLLSDTLQNLNNRKAQLSRIPQVNPTPPIDKKFSHEQQLAITSNEPLILTQAGAGTGKSTVVLARIKYMIDCGINPEDITVLSFTNAAADNITARNPQVHSMTIARMIHSIYALNFPHHELSSIDTIINSLDIFFPQDVFAYEFRRHLYAVMKNDRDAFTRMNNFIEANYDNVMRVLDTIKQTSLELEIIICYQKIDILQEPADVQSRYLIIDEVQDNSIFEFIYTLKYIDKHNESLFLVGDCSQTLYEFRASNPKALNVLEGSGVFATYQLQTNYRSNQEILDFANVALSDIEANQYANIQLRANSFAPVTEASFKEKVQLDYTRIQRVSDISKNLEGLLRIRCGKFIRDKLVAKEQVAFLAYKRRDVAAIETALRKQYPNAKIVNLVPERMYNSTIMSSFIRKYWSTIKFAPTQSAVATIIREISRCLPYIVSNTQKSTPIVANLLQAWRQENTGVITAWQAQLNNGTLSHQQFMENLRENMLLFEIRRNAVRQSMLAERNKNAKANNAAENADFVISTIHSAKGLEFDNTVILYRADNIMNEEDKRMYYVAFTRAMKSEFILAYDTVVNPKIQGDYDAIVKALHEKENPPAKANARIVAGRVQVINKSADDNQEDEES